MRLVLSLRRGTALLVAALVVLSASDSESQIRPRHRVRAYYTSTFDLTQNPAREGVAWINGLAQGRDWQDCETSGGFLHGATTGHADDSCNFDANCQDPTCLLTGVWGADQTITMTVVNSVPKTSGSEEVECRLRSTLAAHRNTGYEVLWSLTNNPYISIVRWDWDGTTQAFVELITPVTGSQIVTGDVLKCTLIGTTIKGYTNGVERVSYDTASDSIKYSTGAPGHGLFLQGHAASAYGEFGITQTTITTQ